MKCPYCNQEHENEMAFCPITGKKLYVITQRTCHKKACSLNRYYLPKDYKVCPVCGGYISSDSFFGKTPNDGCVPDLELNDSNSSHCEECGQMHLNESKVCPIKGKSIRPEKVCAKCGNKIESPEHVFCSKCGSDTFKNNFTQTTASALWDFTKLLLKVIITIPSVLLGILTLPLMLVGQPYSAVIYHWVKEMWSGDD